MPTIPDADAAPTAGGGALRAAVAHSVVGKGVEVVTLALLATVVPRWMGAADYGAFSVPLTVVTLGSLALTLGGPSVLGRFVPTAPPAERPALAVAIGRRLALGRAAQLVAITVVASGVVVAGVGDLSTGRIVAVVAALWFGVAAQLALQVGLGLGRTVPWSFRYPLHNAVLIGAVLALYPSHGVPGAVVAIVVANAATALLGVWVLAPLRGVGDGDRSLPEGAVRFGRYQAAGAALTQFAQRGGVLAAAVFAAGTEAAVYAALAIGIALGATYAVLQAFTVMLPELSARAEAARAGGGPGPVSAKVPRPSAGADTAPELDVAVGPLRRLAGWVLALVVPGAVGAMLVVEPAVRAVVGDEFTGAAPAFIPAAAVVVLAPLHSVIVQLTALRFRPEVAFVKGVAAAGAFVVVSVLAVPAAAAGAEATAALVATLVGFATAVVVGAVAFRRDLGIGLVAASAGGLAAVLAVGTVTVGW